MEWCIRLVARIVQQHMAVGQTARALSQRLKEPKSALTNSHPEKSTIAEHAMDTGHTINWDNAQIMALMPKLYQCITLETWYMRS